MRKGARERKEEMVQGTRLNLISVSDKNFASFSLSNVLVDRARATLPLCVMPCITSSSYASILCFLFSLIVLKPPNDDTWLQSGKSVVSFASCNTR